jgi:hypothetical protein
MSAKNKRRISFNIDSQTAQRLRQVTVDRLSLLAESIQSIHYGGPLEYEVDEYSKLRTVFLEVLHGKAEYAQPVEHHIAINKETQAKETSLAKSLQDRINSET